MVDLVKRFLQLEAASGIILFFTAVLALILANSPWSEIYFSFLDIPVQFRVGSLDVHKPLLLWINDGLMAIFFLLVGMEIKREALEGSLSSMRQAGLPVIAAIGGMIVPAAMFSFIINDAPQFMAGWAIPMATDIAFSLAIISLLGKSVPVSLKIFLTALAIVDDLGAIMVIAIFYTDQIHWSYLGLSALMVLFLALLNFFNFKKHIFYLIPGILLWYFMHHSGIHATIAGVLLAFTIPTNVSATEISPLEKLEQKLHLPVSFLIMPLFALANTNITFKTGMVDGLFSSLGYGIILGLFLGKLIGINLFSYIFIKLKISSLPYKSTWPQMLGTGLLAGIGFTMSIFIALLSFKGHSEIQDEAKFAILIASLISGISGYLILKNFRKTTLDQD